MRNLKSVLILLAFCQGMFFSYLYGQTKDIYGNPSVYGNLNYPSGSALDKVNVYTGSSRMIYTKQPEIKTTISVNKQSEDSILGKEVKIFKQLHGEKRSEKELKIIADSIVQQGLQLYKLERIARVSTDMIRALKSNVLFDGYISYFAGDSIKTIYYYHDSLGTKIKIDASIHMKDSINDKNVRVKRIDRIASAQELLLIEIKKEIISIMAESPSMSEYQNQVIPNIVPIIKGDKLCFYVLPSSFEQTSFYMGGDYMFEYSHDKKLLSITPLHKGLIRIHTLENTKINTSYHTHLPDHSEFMTAPDICQAKLYGKMTIGVTKYIVICEGYSSDYNTETDQLIITDNQWNQKEISH